MTYSADIFVEVTIDGLELIVVAVENAEELLASSPLHRNSLSGINSCLLFSNSSSSSRAVTN